MFNVNDTVNHDLLMHLVSRKVRDKRVFSLIGKYLRAAVKVKGRLEKTRLGVLQGGPLSPLLANILLDTLDKELERRGHKFVRYADDQPMSEGSRFIVCQRTVGEASLPGYGPVILANRQVRTRMPGGVGAGGEKPPATRQK